MATILSIGGALCSTRFDLELDQTIELELYKNKIDTQLFHVMFDKKLTTKQAAALKNEKRSERVNQIFDGKLKNPKSKNKMESVITQGRYSGKSFCKYIIRE